MESIIKNFNNHGFITSYFENRNDAIIYLKKEINNEFVSFGGSMTLEELNLYEILKSQNKVLWHWKGDSREDARMSDVFITSANAITKDGKILNIDGSGNRVAMTIFGPKKCFFIVGKNKIADNIEDAYKRCKEVACVKNAKRLNLDLPCVKLNKCVDCNNKNRICRAITILERPTTNMEVHLIIIDENLGY